MDFDDEQSTVDAGAGLDRGGPKVADHGLAGAIVYPACCCIWPSSHQVSGPASIAESSLPRCVHASFAVQSLIFRPEVDHSSKYDVRPRLPGAGAFIPPSTQALRQRGRHRDNRGPHEEPGPGGPR